MIKKEFSTSTKAIKEIAIEKFSNQSNKKFNNIEFDIFLSHNYKNLDLILGIKLLLEESGYCVYVEWSKKDRFKKLNKYKDMLRKRIKESKSVFYVICGDKKEFNFTYWKLGFFEGLKEDKVAIVPILIKNRKHLRKNKYLKIYPFLKNGIFEWEVSYEGNKRSSLESWIA